MHVLYVHQNFPAQFGHIAAHLVEHLGWRCTFVTEREPGVERGIEKIQYITRGGPTRQQSFHTRSFESCVNHAEAVHRALKARPDVRPDLIVGHSGFGSTIFLPQLYDVPIINFFEYYYRARDSDLDFRPDCPVGEKKQLRSRVRNAMILLDLQNCDAGYTPTAFQHHCFPPMYRPRIRRIFDGVDTAVYRRIAEPTRTWKNRTIAPGTRVVTYCARGFEKMRGFDIFLEAARIVSERMPDVVFLVAGTDRICYGGDREQIAERSLRHHLFKTGKYDRSKFIFIGWIGPEELANLLSLGDAHVYLTVPFVLSWSLMNALACGAVVVGSDTAPVQEMIRHGENGFLKDFFDAEAIAARLIEILEDPPACDPIRHRAMELIKTKYSLEAVLPQMLEMYEQVLGKERGGVRGEA
jgi:glycosyltransferase involved in cell wall biosynthesis